MAATAHWIEADTVATLEGPQYKLKLRSDLIGFHRVPGRHDGEHLAHAFLHILDRLDIAHLVYILSCSIIYLPYIYYADQCNNQIGWVTLDNASNNDTFMTKLEELLHARNISFHRIKRRIRCVTFFSFSKTIFMCS